MILRRRDVLAAAALVTVGRSGTPLGGIFPVLGSALDIVRVAGANGVVWQGMAGAEAVIAAARARFLAVILCVQGGDVASTRRQARGAERLSPDAVMASPLGVPRLLAEHYRAIAGECGLPIVAHAAGEMSIEFVLRMRDEIPALRLVKDEAGHTLSRISEYRRSAPDLAVFTGGEARTLAGEIERGACGAMPPIHLAAESVRIWKDSSAFTGPLHSVAALMDSHVEFGG